MSAFNLPNTASGVFDPGLNRPVNAAAQPMQMPGYNADPMGLSGFGGDTRFFDDMGDPTEVRFGPQGPFDPTGRPQYGGVKQALGESLDMIRDLAMGGDERRAEIDASKGRATGAIEEGFGAQQGTLQKKADDIFAQRDLALGDIEEGFQRGDEVMRKAERTADRRLKAAGAASKAATAIDAGRRAGEQTTQLKAQMGAQGMTGAQQVAALQQMDAPRQQQTAAALNQISADVAQGRAQVAMQMGTARGQMAMATGQAKAQTRATMTEMYGTALSELGASQAQEGQLLAQLETTYQGMKENTYQEQAAFTTAYGNAAATGSNLLMNIFNNIGPGVDFRTLGLAGDLFEAASFLED